MMTDERDDPFAFVVGETQPLGQRCRHIGADSLVLVKGVVLRRFVKASHARFGDVMQEGRHPHDGRGGGRGVYAAHGVLPDVVSMVAVLRASHRLEQLRCSDGQEAVLAHDLEGAARLPCFHRLDPLVSNSLRAHLSIRVERGGNGALGFGIERELQRGDEPSRAENSQAVFRETLLGYTDGAENPRLEVSDTAKRVDELLRLRVEGNRIDREVTARQIELDVVDEANLVRTATIRVGRLPA